MSEQEHTKGKLKIEKDHRFALNIGEKHIAMVNIYNCIEPEHRVTDEESLANAKYIVLCWNTHDTLTKRGYDLDKELRDIRPYAACYRSVCKQLCIESNILGYIYTIENHRDKLLAVCETVVERGILDSGMIEILKVAIEDK